MKSLITCLSLLMLTFVFLPSAFADQESSPQDSGESAESAESAESLKVEKTTLEKNPLDAESKKTSPTLESSQESPQRALLPLRPGLAIKSGGGLHRSIPCNCFDRGLFTAEFVGRLHFGWRLALEADFRFGSMILGGRFPGEGWAVGGMVRLFEPGSNWMHGAHLRAGFRQWRVMGMRGDSSPGPYGALNWQFPALSFLSFEVDLVAGRTFEAMEHWYFAATGGVSIRPPR